MRKLTVFNFTTLNGFFKGPDDDISWHRHESEEGDYAANMLQSDGILLFGRKTYEMMAGYWASPMALENDPLVAAGMNNAEKIVFSQSLQNADWNNTTLIKDNIVETIRKMKQSPGKDMAILGSGTIVTLFAEAGLIDEFQIMIDPVVLGQGTPLLEGIRGKIDLELTSIQQFKTGVVLLCYRLL